MIPFGTSLVTLLHSDDGKTWKPYRVTSASWSKRQARRIEEGASIVREETVCRIPAGGVIPSAGDVIILGECLESADGEIALARLLERYRKWGAFRVQSVADNARPRFPLPHYAARGE